MQAVIQPKCPYCGIEFKPFSMINNPLRDLSASEYGSSTVRVMCQSCHNYYFVSKQVRYIARKVK